MGNFFICERYLERLPSGEIVGKFVSVALTFIVCTVCIIKLRQIQDA